MACKKNCRKIVRSTIALHYFSIIHIIFSLERDFLRMADLHRPRGYFSTTSFTFCNHSTSSFPAFVADKFHSHFLWYLYVLYFSIWIFMILFFHNTSETIPSSEAAVHEYIIHKISYYYIYIKYSSLYDSGISTEISPDFRILIESAKRNSADYSYYGFSVYKCR